MAASVDIEKLEKKARNRERAVKELISTEETYVTLLEKLISLFANPLRDFKLMTQQEYFTVFPNDLRTITHLGRTLLDDLNYRTHEFDVNTTVISDILLDFAPFFKMYQTYLQNNVAASQTVSRLSESSKKFATFIADRREECNNLHLNSLLILPVQRIPRYKIIVEEIYKNTLDTHPDYKGLGDALAVIIKVNSENNERLREIESRVKVSQVEQELTEKISLLTPSRMLLYETWPVNGRHMISGSKTELKVYIFNDLLLAASPKSSGLFGMSSSEVPESFKLKVRLPIDHAFEVLDFAKGYYASTIKDEYLAISFAVRTCIECVIFECPSPEKKKEMMDQFDNAVEIARVSSLDSGTTPVLFKYPLWLIRDGMCQKCLKSDAPKSKRINCGYCGLLMCKDCQSEEALPDLMDSTDKVDVCLDCFNDYSGGIRSGGFAARKPPPMKMKAPRPPGGAGPSPMGGPPPIPPSSVVSTAASRVGSGGGPGFLAELNSRLAKSGGPPPLKPASSPMSPRRGPITKSVSMKVSGSSSRPPTGGPPSIPASAFSGVKLRSTPKSPKFRPKSMVDPALSKKLAFAKERSESYVVEPGSSMASVMRPARRPGPPPPTSFALGSTSPKKRPPPVSGRKASAADRPTRPPSIPKKGPPTSSRPGGFGLEDSRTSLVDAPAPPTEPVPVDIRMRYDSVDSGPAKAPPVRSTARRAAMARPKGPTDADPSSDVAEPLKFSRGDEMVATRSRGKSRHKNNRSSPWLFSDAVPNPAAAVAASSAASSSSRSGSGVPPKRRAPPTVASSSAVPPRGPPRAPPMVPPSPSSSSRGGSGDSASSDSRSTPRSGYRMPPARGAGSRGGPGRVGSGASQKGSLSKKAVYSTPIPVKKVELSKKSWFVWKCKSVFRPPNNTLLEILNEMTKSVQWFHNELGVMKEVTETLRDRPYLTVHIITNGGGENVKFIEGLRRVGLKGDVCVFCMFDTAKYKSVYAGMTGVTLATKYEEVVSFVKDRL